MINKAIQFLKNSYNELRKVSWLSKREVVGSTVVIMIFILIIALFVGFADFLLSRVIGLFLQR